MDIITVCNAAVFVFYFSFYNVLFGQVYCLKMSLFEVVGGFRTIEMICSFIQRCIIVSSAEDFGSLQSETLHTHT